MTILEIMKTGNLDAVAKVIDQVGDSNEFDEYSKCLDCPYFEEYGSDGDTWYYCSKVNPEEVCDRLGKSRKEVRLDQIVEWLNKEIES